MGRCMTDEPPRKVSKPAPSDRESRLKSALKANLARRKAQARARDTDEGGDPADPDNKDQS